MLLIRIGLIVSVVLYGASAKAQEFNPDSISCKAWYFGKASEEACKQGVIIAFELAKGHWLVDSEALHEAAAKKCSEKYYGSLWLTASCSDGVIKFRKSALYRPMSSELEKRDTKPVAVGDSNPAASLEGAKKPI